MGSNSKDTLFKSDGGGAGQSASDYLKDSFQDISIKATTNSTLTSTALTNPLSKFFFNTDAPVTGYKTLYVKDLVILQDRSMWINQKPTYEVIFTESFPGIFAYCFGDIRLRDSLNGKSVDVRSVDDGFGVGGVIRRAAWILNPTPQATANADIVVDGVDTTNDVDFSGSPSVPPAIGVNKYYIANHANANETKNIHDFRITANQTGLLSVAGITVYFENATSDIDVYPGTTYVDKNKEVTTNLTTQALATITGRNGGKTLLYKTTSNTYSTTTVEAPSIETVGTGTINTNLISVTTSQGASFPAGSGVVGIASGTSFYVGAVLSVSTDTLTMGTTLGFALNGPLYKAWWAGPTIGINASLYAVASTFDPSYGSVDGGMTLGFASAQAGCLSFQDPNKKYRAWGNQVKTAQVEGYYGVGFTGSGGFFTVGGYASAMEVEFSGAGILHGTFSINGCVSWNLNEGFTGMVKKTVFTDAGPGWNQFSFGAGSSFGGAVISRVNLYEMQPNVGQTLGRLMSYDTLVNGVERAAINASFGWLGTYRRVFGDELYLKGSWTKGFTSTSVGGVFWAGSSSNSVLNFNYFGKNFGIIGTAGATVNITLDGASISSAFNVMKSVATLTFHSVTVTPANGTTSLIEAVDFMRTRDEITSLQNYLPAPSMGSGVTVFQQGGTPRNPKPGDIWAQNRDAGSIWVYLFDKWNKLSINLVADDPNAPTELVKSHGSNAGTTDSGGQLTVEHFNFISWYAGVSAGTASNSLGVGEAAYFKKMHALDGIDTGGSIQTFHQAYDKIAWATLTNPGSARQGYGIAQYLGHLLWGNGSTNTSHTGGDNTWDRWNGAAWATGVGTTGGAGRTARGSWVSEGLLHASGGTSAAGAASADHDVFNGTGFVASVVQPAAKMGGVSSRSTVGGFMGWGNNSNGAYVWNGAGWHSPTARVFNADGSESSGACGGYDIITSRGIYNGGTEGGAATTSLTRTDSWNGVAFVADVASATARAGCSGAVY
jgi:hypothetical protein